MNEGRGARADCCAISQRFRDFLVRFLEICGAAEGSLDSLPRQRAPTRVATLATCDR